MRARAHSYTFALAGGLLVAAGCGGSWLQVRHLPEDGYTQTINYQFQARIHEDAEGQCQRMVIRVKALNKMYSSGQPPPRLRLYDDDCMEPVRFERAQFLSEEGAQVQLYGIEVVHFLGSYQKMEGELLGWLWREGAL